MKRPKKHSWMRGGERTLSPLIETPSARLNKRFVRSRAFATMLFPVVFQRWTEGHLACGCAAFSEEGRTKYLAARCGIISRALRNYGMLHSDDAGLSSISLSKGGKLEVG